jgi:hypothetical protein
VGEMHGALAVTWKGKGLSNLSREDLMLSRDV